MRSRTVSTRSRSPTRCIRCVSRRRRARRAERHAKADEAETTRSGRGRRRCFIDLDGETEMADAHAKPHHDYHLVEPSVWPAVGSVSAFLMAVGAITWMHHMTAAAPYIFGVGTIGMAYTMFGWWRDVAREATYDGYHTRDRKSVV